MQVRLYEMGILLLQQRQGSRSSDGADQRTIFLHVDHDGDLEGKDVQDVSDVIFFEADVSMPPSYVDRLTSDEGG